MKKQNMPKITLETIDRKLDGLGVRLGGLDASLMSINDRLDEFVDATARGFATITREMGDFKQRVDFRFSQLESRIDRVSDLEIES